MNTAKDKIPKQYRISDTCFKLMENIGVNLFMRHPKNNNHAHKDSNNFMSVIIILGTDVHGGETVFHGMTMNEIGRTALALNH